MLKRTLILGCVLSLVACGDQATEKKLIGTWENTLPDTFMRMELKPARVLEWQNTKTTPPTTLSGSWRVKDNKLILDPSELIPGRTISTSGTILRLSRDELEVRATAETVVLFRRVQ